MSEKRAKVLHRALLRSLASPSRTPSDHKVEAIARAILQWIEARFPGLSGPSH